MREESDGPGRPSWGNEVMTCCGRIGGEKGVWGAERTLLEGIPGLLGGRDSRGKGEVVVWQQGERGF
jgi:hypothetical protein